MNQFFPLRRSVLLLLAGSLLFFTCAKEYSYEGGALPTSSSSGTAVYTLSGASVAPDTCQNFKVTGNYYTGLALDTSNTVVLEVNVTTAGTYSINIGSQNGFGFSGSGTFSTTGIQTIKLTASGAPGFRGVTTFSTPLSSVCTFEVYVFDKPATYILSGAPNDCQNFKVNGDYHPGKALTNLNTVDIVVDVTSTGYYQITTDTLDGISFYLDGTFTSTGKQTISIVGQGAPTAARNLVFTPKIIGGSSQCTFALAVTDNNPLATYVIESGTANAFCIFTANGTYTKGVPLTTSNSLTIRVAATVVGNYTVATNSANGIMFAHSGTFTTLGSQLITLEGSGTPVASGTFSFKPQIVGPTPIGGASCTLDLVFN